MMIDYEFVYRCREIKEDQSKKIIIYVKGAIIYTIENMFKPQEKGDKNLLNIILNNMDFEVFKNGDINVYFGSVYQLDWLKTRCSFFENNIKMTLNRLGETIRFIFNNY